MEKRFDLPNIHFVGGATKPLSFYLRTKSGEPFDLNGATVTFSLSELDSGMEPCFSKPCEVRVEPVSGIRHIAYVVLEPDDTVDLHGKYLYQVTVRDEDNAIDLLQGIMLIRANRDTALI